MQLTFTDYTFGASVATALVLTAPEVLVATGDALTDGESLHAFLTEHGIVPGDRPATVADLDEVRALRTRVRDIVAAPNEEAIVDGANQLLCVARTVPFLGRHDGTWTWHLETAPESTLADDLAVVIGTGLLGTVASLDRTGSGRANPLRATEFSSTPAGRAGAGSACPRCAETVSTWRTFAPDAVANSRTAPEPAPQAPGEESMPIRPHHRRRVVVWEQRGVA